MSLTDDTPHLRYRTKLRTEWHKVVDFGRKMYLDIFYDERAVVTACNKVNRFLETGHGSGEGGEREKRYDIQRHVTHLFNLII